MPTPNRHRRTVIALMLCIGALLFIPCARTYAIEGLWDSYKQPVGFTYGAQARIQTAYLWRGIYSGGANLQGSAEVGYGGLYANMWWNIGVADWRFNTFQPEMDLSIGFKRWGLNIYLLYIYNFKSGPFDMTNYPDKGNRLGIDIAYTLSDKLPLTFLWETRVYGSDGYVNAAGDTIRAYSSYAEINYTQHLPKGWSLYGAIGITPWRSGYTGYKRDFAVQNIDIRVRKDWSISERCGLMVMGQVMIDPSALAADKSTAQWKPYNPGNQSVNANMAVGVYLK